MANSQQQRIRGKYYGKKLKAKELIRLYREENERNFQGAILRGQSFKGQDLSEADFSEADIRSTNFSNTTVVNTNFSGAQCGLQKRWIIIQTYFAVLMSNISLFCSVLVGIASLLIFDSDAEYQKVGYTVLLLSSVFLISTLTKGMKIGILSITIAIVLVPVFQVYNIKPIEDYYAALVISGVSAIAAGILIVGGVLSTAIISCSIMAILASKSHFSAKLILLLISLFILLIGGIWTAVGMSSFDESGTQILLVTWIAVSLLFLGIYIALLIRKGNTQDIWIHNFAVIYSCLKGTNFQNSNLASANFTKARLKSTDFRNANLKHVRWYKATMLNQVRTKKTYLNDFEVRKWITGGVGNKNFDNKNLQGINLQGINLINASFINTDLSDAILSDTTITGACIQDWNINSETRLDNVICDYVYLKSGQRERRPSDKSRNFQPGEFAKLVSKSLNSVDLIFRKGVNWKAVAYSLKNTQVLNQDTPLAIQSIENKGNGVVLIKVTVPQNANKGRIEGDFWQGYEFANKTLKEQYEVRLLDKDKFINEQSQQINQLFYSLNQAQEKLGQVPKLMAEQPKFQQNFNAPVYGNAQNVEGDQNNYASEPKQTLAEAAEEIQKLLQQLEQTNPTATEEEKIIYVNDETSPGLKRRTVSALKAGVETSIEEFLDNPYVNVGKAVVKGWMKPE